MKKKTIELVSIYKCPELNNKERKKNVKLSIKILTFVSKRYLMKKAHFIQIVTIAIYYSIAISSLSVKTLGEIGLCVAPLSVYREENIGSILSNGN